MPGEGILRVGLWNISLAENMPVDVLETFIGARDIRGFDWKRHNHISLLRGVEDLIDVKPRIAEGSANIAVGISFINPKTAAQSLLSRMPTFVRHQDPIRVRWIEIGPEVDFNGIVELH
ncbi:MAG TPA: hypothetical protein VGU72_16700 [Beijerinckiaceae bacterium]|nr:hypothetical protein [Beijerinckiaceae bacterium]